MKPNWWWYCYGFYFVSETGEILDFDEALGIMTDGVSYWVYRGGAKVYVTCVLPWELPKPANDANIR